MGYLSVADTKVCIFFFYSTGGYILKSLSQVKSDLESKKDWVHFRMIKLLLTVIVLLMQKRSETNILGDRTKDKSTYS